MKILKFLGWVDYRGNFDSEELLWDIAMVSVIIAGVSVGVYYG